MNAIVEEVCAFLDDLSISYELIEHAQAMTIADCAENDARLHAVTVKNYFLTTRNRKRSLLCIVRPNARFASSDISHQAGTPRLCFADEAMLMERLRVRPGSVTPLALIFDRDKQVQLLADRALEALPRLAFHPCDNRYSIAMSSADFFSRFLPAVQHEPQWIEVHDFLENETKN